MKLKIREIQRDSFGAAGGDMAVYNGRLGAPAGVVGAGNKKILC
jgi:hypothetical protein